MKTVYRVEHIEYRHGPYVSYGMTKRSKELAEKMRSEVCKLRQPLIHDDGIEYRNDDQYCGFDSLDALFNWFEHWLDELEKHDYHIAVFDVEDSDIVEGVKQVLFRRKKYRRIAVMRMEEIQCEM